MNEYEHNIREVAAFLYKLHADPHDYEVRVLWEDDTWEVNTNSVFHTGVKNDFYNKAIKIWTHYEDVKDIKKMLKFLNNVNPKLFKQFVSEL